MIEFINSAKKYLVEAMADFTKRPGYNLRPLDGLRALAIIFVVCMHVNELVNNTPGYAVTILSKVPPFRGGWIGVPLFFVLSGFLIGGQLWKEFFQKGDISFWRFIFRRGFRIWPLYFFVMIIVYLFSITLTYDFKELMTNLFFLGNYLNDTGPIFGSWSLATEEQFYIIAPLFLILMNKFFPNKSFQFYRRILFVLFLTPVFLRYVSWDLVLGMRNYDINAYMKYIYRPFHTNSEGLIAGMIVSNFYHDKESFLNRKVKISPLFYLLAAALFCASFYSKVYFNFTGIALGFSAMLIYGLTARGKMVDFLSRDFLFIISKASFAIYLIHVHVIKNLISLDLVKTLSFGQGILEMPVAFILVMGMSVLIAIVLYVMIEKPFMLLRERFLQRIF